MSLILDPTFGAGGIVATPFPPDFFDGATGVAIQRNRRIVAAGHSGGLLVPSDFVVARYRPNGVLDPSLGGTGYVDTDFNAGSNDLGNALLLLPNGRMVVAGRSDAPGFYYHFALARYDTTGKLDPTFGNKGLVMTQFGGPSEVSEVRALALQTDGKIVAAGAYYPAGSSAPLFALARYLANGNLDTSFGAQGKVITPLPGHHAEAYGVAIQPSGRIVAIGEARLGSQYLIALAGYSAANGGLDASFGNKGVVLTHVGTAASGRALAVTAGGKLVGAGWATASGLQRMAVVRYLPNGALDTTFNATGKSLSAPLWGHGQAHAVAVLRSGAIIAAGQMYPSVGTSFYQFALTGFHQSGALDGSIGMSGTILTPIGSFAAAHALAVQPDQRKIIAAGFSEIVGGPVAFALARYLYLI